MNNRHEQIAPRKRVLDSESGNVSSIVLSFGGFVPQKAGLYKKRAGTVIFHCWTLEN